MQKCDIHIVVGTFLTLPYSIDSLSNTNITPHPLGVIDIVKVVGCFSLQLKLTAPTLSQRQMLVDDLLHEQIVNSQRVCQNLESYCKTIDHSLPSSSGEVY